MRFFTKTYTSTSKVSSSGGWDSSGVHDLPFPVRTKGADPIEGSWVQYPTGAHW